MSSVEMLNPDEAGAMGEEERRRKGFRRLLGFDVQVVFLAVVGDEPPAFGVACWESNGSGRVDVDSLRAASPQGGGWVSMAVGFLEQEIGHGFGRAENEVPGEDEEEDAEGTGTESSFESGAPLSSRASDSSALGSGRGAKRILRELGIELLRTPGR